MFENMTYETILQRMLNKIPNTLDKREGSIIYDALASAAIEFQNMYIYNDAVLNESFADTASRTYLIKRCAEKGIYVEEATQAVRQGEFNIDVPIGSRYSLNKLNYIVIEKIDDGVFKLQCETAGAEGNMESGTLVPIDYIDGLQTATLTDILIPGVDDEDTEHLRQRYFESFESQAFGGNVADYKKKIKSLNGVGGVKVKPVWNGGGTVKVIFTTATHTKPSTVLVDEVQEATDPIQNQGKGSGFAPIGHTVTVVGCDESAVDVQTHITFQEGWNWESIKGYVESVIDDYFKELSATWDSLEENEGLIVRISQIETRLLDLTGILDIDNTTLNGVAQNLTVEPHSIPVRGVTTNV